MGTVDRQTLAAAIPQRVEEWRGLLTRRTSHVRQLLRKLVDGPMIFTPTPDDPGVWEFRATGRIDRLLAGIENIGAKQVNVAGGRNAAGGLGA